jgi:hypothetical protein
MDRYYIWQTHFATATLGEAMKHSFLATLMIVLVTAAATMSAGDLSVGATVIAKAGINTVVPDGVKTDLNFNDLPDINASVLYLFSNGSNTGINLDLGYDSYTFKMRPESDALSNDLTTSTSTYRNFSIAPSLFLGGFQLGVAYGIPMSYSEISVDGTRNNTSAIEALIGKPSSTIELRVGAVIPVMRGKSSSLNFNIRAGYMLSGMHSNGPITDDDYIPKTASLGAGISYYFTVAE